MGDRTVPFDEETQCDVCGKIGVYDFMGDCLCPECAKKYIRGDEEAKAVREGHRLAQPHLIMDKLVDKKLKEG